MTLSWNAGQHDAGPDFGPAPSAYLMVGLQGSGKPPPPQKIAKFLTEKQRKKVLMARRRLIVAAAQDNWHCLGPRQIQLPPAYVATINVERGHQTFLRCFSVRNSRSLRWWWFFPTLADQPSGKRKERAKGQVLRRAASIPTRASLTI